MLTYQEATPRPTKNVPKPPHTKGTRGKRKTPLGGSIAEAFAIIERGKHAFCVSLSLGGCSSAEPLTFHDRAKIILFPIVAHFVGGFFGIATSACLWLPRLIPLQIQEPSLLPDGGLSCHGVSQKHHLLFPTKGRVIAHCNPCRVVGSSRVNAAR